MSKKSKLIIVGSFSPERRKVFGGIARSSEILINSKSFSQFQIIKFDSSQISNPPPHIFIRSFLAILRLIKFTSKVLIIKPESALIFCSDGGSAIEKGLMTLIARIFNIKAFIFPRAGNLINQIKKSKLMLFIIKKLFSKATLFLCQGEQWRIFAINDLKINQNKVKTIANWSATDNLIKIGKRRKIIKNNTVTKILYIGWLEKEKGIKELIEVFAKLYQSNNNIELNLVGDGRMRNYTQSFIKTNNLSKNIFIKGWMSSDKIEDYLKTSDIFVFPSWKEGMPNALIEALAAGVPSVTTSVGVIPDYLQHNFSTLFIDAKNQNNLQKSLEKLINDINLRIKLSKNGLSVAEKFFSSRTSLENFSKIIQETLN